MSICSFFTLRLFTLSWRKRTWAVRILYAALSALFGVLDPKRNPGTGERVYLNGTIITYILSKTLRGVLRRDDVGRASGRTFSGKLPNVATCARSVGFYGFAIVACPKKTYTSHNRGNNIISFYRPQRHDDDSTDAQDLEEVVYWIMFHSCFSFLFSVQAWNGVTRLEHTNTPVRPYARKRIRYHDRSMFVNIKN